MGNLTIALTFVVIMNVLMILTQATMLDLNPASTNFFNKEGSVMCSLGNDCDNLTINSQELTSNLPETNPEVSPTTGNLFTDTFSSVRKWITSKYDFVKGVLTAPYNLLNALGLPLTFVWAMGSLWYLITFFVIIGWFVGRD